MQATDAVRLFRQVGTHFLRCISPCFSGLIFPSTPPSLEASASLYRLSVSTKSGKDSLINLYHCIHLYKLLFRYAQPYFCSCDHTSLGPHGVGFRIILLYDFQGHEKENPRLRQLSLD